MPTSLALCVVQLCVRVQPMIKPVSYKDEDNEWPDSDEDTEDGKLMVVRPAALHTSDTSTQPTSTF